MQWVAGSQPPNRVTDGGPINGVAPAANFRIAYGAATSVSVNLATVASFVVCWPADIAQRAAHAG